MGECDHEEIKRGTWSRIPCALSLAVVPHLAECGTYVLEVAVSFPDWAGVFGSFHVVASQRCCLSPAYAAYLSGRHFARVGASNITLIVPPHPSSKQIHPTGNNIPYATYSSVDVRFHWELYTESTQRFWTTFRDWCCLFVCFLIRHTLFRSLW